MLLESKARDDNIIRRRRIARWVNKNRIETHILVI